jgi:hypothetical protein
MKNKTGDRTHNLWFHRPAPYPLSHEVLMFRIIRTLYKKLYFKMLYHKVEIYQRPSLDAGQTITFFFLNAICFLAKIT